MTIRSQPGSHKVSDVADERRTPGHRCPSEYEYSEQGDRQKLLGEDEPTFTRVDDNVIQPYL